MRHVVTEEEWIDVSITVPDPRPELPSGMTQAEADEFDRRWRAFAKEVAPELVTDKPMRIHMLAAFPPGFALSVYSQRRCPCCARWVPDLRAHMRAHPFWRGDPG